MLQPVTAIQKSVSTCLKIYRHCTSSLRTMPLHTRQLYPSRNWPSRIWCSCHDHPLHSPDLASMDLAIFSLIKSQLKGWNLKILINWNMQLAQLYPELTVIGIPVCLIHGLWNVKSRNSEKWVKFKIKILQKLQTVKCQTDSCVFGVLCFTCITITKSCDLYWFLYICTIIVCF